MREVLKKMGLNTNRYMRDSNFTTIDRTFNLHPSEGTHGVLYENQ